jgi:REP element-mobilizing transposase RayT
MKRGRHRIDQSSYPIFVTTTIVDWKPVFANRDLAGKCLSVLEKIRAEMDMSVMAFVLMLIHFHGILRAEAKGDISIFMGKWKSLTARHIIDNSRENHPHRLEKFESSALRHKLAPRQAHQVWMPRFDDFAIRNEEQFLTKLGYILVTP